ncbi:MAG: dTDP-glucose 4,6-dehydratase [Chloroflexi bacterium]|jgi:dTDP-glucose 4,6-dehydratase|nr:MAG: dTDP-glucose 4,6-dehydratase [Chloroflexota bacterium]
MSVGKRALVTGGAGFLGSHLCERLLAEGYEVVCLDNLLTGDAKNVLHLQADDRFTFHKADVTEPLNEDVTPDIIFHLASLASPVHYSTYPIETLRVGSLGADNVLELARRGGATVVFSSTSEVYGDPEINPQPESYWGNVNPVGPRSMYDEAKRYSEALAVAFYRHYGVDVRLARIFNTYGSRMRLDDGRVLPNFMVQALTGKPLTVYGDGSQTRSLCFVDDLVEGLLRAAHWQSKLTKGQPQTGEPLIVNLGNPDEATVLQLAQEIIAVTGSDSTIDYKPLPGDDPQVRCPDITRAKKILGWEPKVPRSEGLRRVVPYFKEALARGS